MRKFIQPVSMKVPSIGDINPLLDELKVLGYTGFPSDDFVSHPYLVNNFMGGVGFIDNVVAEARCDDGRFEITTFNPDLFLALAACSEGDEFYKGEWVVSTKEGDSFFVFGKLYRVQEMTPPHETRYVIIEKDEKGLKDNGLPQECFRKATAEEIINHFSKEVERKPKSVEKLRDENGDMVRWVPKYGEKIRVWNRDSKKRYEAKFAFLMDEGRVATKYGEINSNRMIVDTYDFYDHIDAPVYVTEEEIQSYFAGVYGVPQELIKIGK